MDTLQKTSGAYSHTVTPTWKVRETPQFKLTHKGLSAVSDLELLSLIVGHPSISQALLTHFGSLTAMARATLQEFEQIAGIGRHKAMLLVSSFELSRRKAIEDSWPQKLSSAQEVANYMIPKLADSTQEVFVVLFLNRNNALLAEETLFSGGVSATVVDSRIISNVPSATWLLPSSWFTITPQIASRPVSPTLRLPKK